jgi:hypothetical protein
MRRNVPSSRGEVYISAYHLVMVGGNVYLTTKEEIMFEVVVFGILDKSVYCGDNWVEALGVYHSHASYMEHVILWENSLPVHEFHPELGHAN